MEATAATAATAVATTRQVETPLPSSNSSPLFNIQTNEIRFLNLLTKLIAEGKALQNNPSQGLIPQEDRASDHILEILAPYSTENGGRLEIQRVSFVDGRGNIILKLPGTNDKKTISFIGSHLDVVPAERDLWDHDPFQLIVDRENDTLYGRGTTDCLGHVALLTDFIISIIESGLQLQHTLIIVFIANEENGSFKGIGVDQLAKEGYLDDLKHGPVYWIDTADSQPCQGTAGNIPWKLEINGKLFHSGMPHQAINPIEMGHDILSYVQKRFYERFPRHEKEVEYNFITSSTMKPTQISCTTSSLNQIPPQCIIMGDVRLTPFYDIQEVVTEFQRWVDEINSNPQETLGSLSEKGPYSKYILPDGQQGNVKLTIIGAENGVAVNMTSPGYFALLDATRNILGDVKPYSINGSLPLVREMQNNGLDLQMSGYGLSSKYHANNESASLSGMKKATQIFANIIAILEQRLE